MRVDYTTFNDHQITAPEHFEIGCDEEYYPDDRVDQRPSEVVQSKLLDLLPRGMAIPVSVFHGQRETRR